MPQPLPPPSPVGTRPRGPHRGRTRILVAIGVVAAALALLPVGDTILWVRDYFLYDNLHEVVPGRFFRSAEMSQERLVQVAQEHGIKTVVDLRMGGPTAKAGQPIDPADLAARGIHYEHVRLNSKRIPPPEQLRLLLRTFADAEVPVLVHCSSGANRTGVASAIWLLEMEGRPLEEAKGQLAMRFGYTVLEYYLNLLRTGVPPLADVLRQFEATGEGRSFGAWVEASQAAGARLSALSRPR
jgi:protein tyrosine phosphatase (PTP) superfamily phosphohydrolase (DUF442 family)